MVSHSAEEIPMHRERPVIRESPDELKALLKQETHRQKRQRLHALFLFASHQATTRQEVARLLGVHRHTIGRWIDCYVAGGLSALLDIYVPAGKAPTLPPSVLADLEHQLHQPEGFASYQAMRIWLIQTHQITIKPKTLQKFVRRRFGACPKVVRPSDIKKS
jgi:Homeodomain-like domain